MQQGDVHNRSVLLEKMKELSRVLFNHLGKEDSHLFHMVSRILTEGEKMEIAEELKAYLSAAQ